MALAILHGRQAAHTSEHPAGKYRVIHIVHSERITEGTSRQASHTLHTGRADKYQCLTPNPISRSTPIPSIRALPQYNNSTILLQRYQSKTETNDPMFNRFACMPTQSLPTAHKHPHTSTQPCDLLRSHCDTLLVHIIELENCQSLKTA